MKKSIPDYIKNGISKWPNWLNLIFLRLNIFNKYAYGRAYVKALKNIEAKDPQKALLDVVNFAIKNVPYYRNRYGNITIKSVQDFETTIGFIDKNEVMNHWNDFVVDNIDPDKCIVGFTGGTCGTPMKLLIPKNRYIHSLAFWHKEMKEFGWNYDTRAVIRNHKLDAGRNYMINPVLKEFVFDAFRMDLSYARIVWQVMKKHNIKYLHAYPSAAYQFLKYCDKQSLDVSFLKLCILASEGVTEEQRFFIEKQMHIKIYSFYGHSEKLIMAGTTPTSDFFHIEQNYGYCELIDSQMKLIKTHNQKGELVGTTFSNYYFPLIRYRTGDYTSYVGNGESDNNGNLDLLNRIEGHRGKSVIYRADGGETSVTALNLHNQIYEHIDGFQYIQEKKGELTMLVIRNLNYTDDDEIFLIEHLKNAMGENSKIELKYVDKLIYQPNGKFLQLISKINY